MTDSDSTAQASSEPARPLSRAALRRAALLVPDGDRLSLLPLLAQDATVAPLTPAVALERLLHYLLDPLGRAILGVDEQLAAWIARSPLLRPCGPGAAVPVSDDLAAVLVAPMLARHDELPEVLVKWRWSPRADEVIAATVATMEPAAGARALAKLREPGPHEELVHQAALQAGRALAWAPHLHDLDDARAVVGELVKLLDRSSPRPQLAALMAALGPIARAQTPLGDTVREHALAQLGAAVARLHEGAEGDAPKGFAAELAALDRPSGEAALARMKAMPDWEHAEWCAHLLGAAAPDDPDAFVDWHRTCSGLFGDLPLFPAFLDGLVQRAAAGPMATLVAAVAAGDDDDRAFAADLSTQLPLDEAEPALRALLEDSRPAVRVSAVRGLTLVGAVDAIAAHLGDPAPEVAAAAAAALIELGEGARLAEHADDPNELRRAAIAAAGGAHDTETLGELASRLIDQLDAASSSEDLEGSPLLDALGTALFTTPEGLHRTAALIGGIPEALPVVALSVPRDDQQQPGVVAPPGPLAELTESLDEVLAADDEPAALALGILAGLSCGDDALARRIAAALAATSGYAGQLLVALAEVRCRTAEGAAALAPLLAADQPIAGRIYAGAAAGRVLPVDHPAWADVTALLELGIYARAAAWASLRDRVRYV